MAEQQFNPVQLIRKKRESETLNKQEIEWLIQEYSADRLPDYQMSAFLMAAFLNGLTNDEAAHLTKAMLESGKKLDLADIPGKKVDKHSTGGVGDKLSLILAPIVAACGVNVPMISGRGLGHTGGTLDKMESIKGFRVDISLERFSQILQKHGMVMSGQTEDVAPADKRMYSLRDVTATVEFIPFIASSIMSKKLAEDIDGLVLDVKFGSGAFMKTVEQAEELARTLVDIGESFGTQTIAYLTRMEQPLGYTVGNWVEMVESLDALSGKGPDDVMEISHLLAGTMIYLGDKAESVEEGIEKSRQAIENGTALRKWYDLVEEQEGDLSMITNPERSSGSLEEITVEASETGYLATLDAYKIGIVSLELGAGRKKKEDEIDHQAGIILHKKVGDSVSEGETILTLRTNKPSYAEVALKLVHEAISITDNQPKQQPLIAYRVDKNGTHSY